MQGLRRNLNQRKDERKRKWKMEKLKKAGGGEKEYIKV